MKVTGKAKEFQRSFHIIKDPHEEIREMVHGQLRGAALSFVHGLLEEELIQLCGSRFSRKQEQLSYRGGSERGSVILEGQRVAVRKPRVRREGKEVELNTYGALQNYDMLQQRVMNHLLSGVSTRNYEGLLDEVSGGLGLKKSMVSKVFVRESREALDLINSRDLTPYAFNSIMIDGIGFGERLVIAAMAITHLGEKVQIGLREGDTENSDVCVDLLQSLIERGLKTDVPILFVTDGSKALKKAIRKVFNGETPTQRCVRHKERNILSYLPDSAHSEFRRRWKKLHGHVDYRTASHEHDQLATWLNQVNHAAYESLMESDMETLTVIKLGVPGLLRKSLLSTNPLESVFSRVRAKSNRVKNWGSGSDQASRWAAVTLLAAEKKSNRVQGYQQIPLLINALNNLKIANQRKVG